MKKYFLLIIVVLAIVAASGCIYSDNYGYAVINETGKLDGGFNQIVVSGSAPHHLIITQGNKESLTVETGRTETSKVQVRVSNNQLFLESSAVVTYRLTVKDINTIILSGPGPGILEADKLNINDLTINMSSGDGEISNLIVNNLHINIMDNSALSVSGTPDQITNSQIVNIYQNGFYNATNLASKRADVHVHNNGFVGIRVSDFLKATVDHNGKINYIGNPKISQQINDVVGALKQIPG